MLFYIHIKIYMLYYHMNIKLLDGNFTICKITNTKNVPLDDDFCFIAKTDEEISLVCLTEHVPTNTVEREDGWKALRIQGQMEFTLVGVLAKITRIIAEENIGVFAVSTFNTDYILTKKDDYEKAVTALIQNGYIVEK